MLTALTLLELLLVIGGILLLAMSVLAPYETLSWWAGWLGGSEMRKAEAASIAQTTRPEDQQLEEGPRYFSVYFSGIGDVAGDFAFPEETALLARLRERLPNTVVIQDIFPYSVINQALTGRRTFVWLWSRLVKIRSASGNNLLTSLINLRNFLQVLVCSDRRYGPIYGYATAKLIVESLKKAGYPEASGKPVTLMGFSGGAQICVSAAPYLRVLLRAPIQVAAIGGVICDDPGVRDVSHLYYLYGARDSLQWLVTWIFPGRWPWLWYSSWNRALRAGKITRERIGPMMHNDPGGYFDADARLPNGNSHAEQTIDHLIGIIRRADELEPLSGRLAGVEGLESLQSQNWDFDSQPSPARSWQEALEVVDRLKRLDGSDVNPVCRTTLLHHGQPTESVYVLLHGFTNCPFQWQSFADELFRSGANVLIPRLPRHGLQDRLTTTIGDLRAEELLAAMDTSLDAARGLGKKITVVGISLGAVMTSWAILHRADIDKAVLVAPSFGYRLLPAFLESRLNWLTSVAPNVFLWWDPRIRASMKPLHAYPRFPSRALYELGRITRDVLHESAKAPPRAREVVVVTNEADLAVRNEMTEEILRLWRNQGFSSVRTHIFNRDLRLIHDVIDPLQEHARISEVYPVLRALTLDRSSPGTRIDTD